MERDRSTVFLSKNFINESIQLKDNFVFDSIKSDGQHLMTAIEKIFIRKIFTENLTNRYAKIKELEMFLSQID